MAKSKSTVQYRDLAFLGFAGYRIGDDGSAWTAWVYQVRPMKIGNEWRRLKPQVQRDGHLTIFPRQVRKPVFVHKLVLEAFVGPCPPGLQCRHFPDRDPANNNLSNLSWATAEVNQHDRLIHGTHCRGEKCYAAKMTEALVRQARTEYAAGGITQRQIARKYGITQGPMSNLLLRKTWKDVA